MIIVTGTKRSGTSMWMQILIAAGFSPFGEAFPRNWGKTLDRANPDGFYESILRRGIYWRTNPHPVSGDYFAPEHVRDHVVKVFIPGLIRTDLAFVGHVIATVRHYHEYTASLHRLYAMEDVQRSIDRPEPVRFPPLLEWWNDNFSLLRDIVTRRYRVHVQSYDGLLHDPDTVVREVIEWLGRGELEPAIAAVKPDNRTQDRGSPEDVPTPYDVEIDDESLESFELLYQTIHRREPLTPSLMNTLNQTTTRLAPLVATARSRVEHGRGH